MTQTLDVKIKKVKSSRLGNVDFKQLKFGSVFSDHMYIADYNGSEWTDMRIIPYGELPTSPALMALHYGQCIFEGMKAYRADSGDIAIFRPNENFKRFNTSAARLCMPHIEPEIFLEGLFNLVRIDQGWVPAAANGYSLYLRPFMYGSDYFVGVRPSKTYRFVILTCPVGSFYPEPLKVKIESIFSRACEGGVGFTKAAGNYGAALKPTADAHDAGYDQIIWTDGKEHKYIEEAGTMNVMFVLDNVLITPSLERKTILPGVTRDSIIALARDMKIKVEERDISVDELVKGLHAGKLQEAFGTGTAATIAHIKSIGYKGNDFELPPIKSRKVSGAIEKFLNDLRCGRIKDTFGWMVKV